MPLVADWVGCCFFMMVGNNQKTKFEQQKMNLLTSLSEDLNMDEKLHRCLLRKSSVAKETFGLQGDHQQTA